MTTNISSDEQDLIDSFTATPPTNGWTAKCADNEAGKQQSINNRIGSGKLPKGAYKTGVATYTAETAAQLYVRLGFCSGTAPTGLFCRSDRDAALVADFLDSGSDTPDPYTGIVYDPNNKTTTYVATAEQAARDCLDDRGFTDLPADTSETAQATFRRLGILLSDGTLADEVNESPHNQYGFMRSRG